LFPNRFGACVGHTIHSDEEWMKVLQSKFYMFINLLQEKYQGAADEVAQSKGEQKRFFKIQLNIIILMNIL